MDKPVTKPPVLPIFLLMLFTLGVNGCCSTGRCYLARAATALEAADPLVVRSIETACAPRVKLCRGGEDCPALVKCAVTLTGYREGRKVAGDALVGINKTLIEAGVE